VLNGHERSSEYEFVMQCWTREELDSLLTCGTASSRWFYYGAYDPDIAPGASDPAGRAGSRAEDARLKRLAQEGTRSKYGFALFVFALGCGSGAAPLQGTRDWAAESAPAWSEDQLCAGVTFEARGCSTPCAPCRRHLFVPSRSAAPALQRRAAADRLRPDDLPTLHRRLHDRGAGCRTRDRVLDLGTGSGYQAAILGALRKRSTRSRIVAPLAERARATLASLGYRNIEVRTGNGLPRMAEACAVRPHHGDGSARRGAGRAPLQQLKAGGLMAIPSAASRRNCGSWRPHRDGTQTLRTLPCDLSR
jgi:protein-L-isoaspartate O-methyltransferase